MNPRRNGNTFESKSGRRWAQTMTSGDQAPVAMFIYNRPVLTARVFERIRAAMPRCLLIVADGPRAARTEDAQLCEIARKIVSSPDWSCDLLMNLADENLGCRRRLSSGLDWVFDQCSEAIILEDDCLPDSSFFTFCTRMLNRYRDDRRVMHVSGDNFQDGNRRGAGSYFFSRYSLSWGWATWKRAWRFYDVNVAAWPAASEERWLESILDDPGEVAYWTDIFEKLHRGEIDTWDYQWLFACWRQGGLSIQPNENLVTNIGAGPDATHFKGEHSTLGIPIRELGELRHPSAVTRDAEQIALRSRNTSPESEMRKEKRWFRRARNKLALRTRMKGLLRSRV